MTAAHGLKSAPPETPHEEAVRFASLVVYGYVPEAPETPRQKASRHDYQAIYNYSQRLDWKTYVIPENIGEVISRVLANQHDETAAKTVRRLTRLLAAQLFLRQQISRIAESDLEQLSNTGEGEWTLLEYIADYVFSERGSINVKQWVDQFGDAAVRQTLEGCLQQEPMTWTSPRLTADYLTRHRAKNYDPISVAKRALIDLAKLKIQGCLVQQNQLPR